MLGRERFWSENFNRDESRRDLKERGVIALLERKGIAVRFKVIGYQGKNSFGLKTLPWLRTDITTKR